MRIVDFQYSKNFKEAKKTFKQLKNKNKSSNCETLRKNARKHEKIMFYGILAREKMKTKTKLMNC